MNPWRTELKILGVLWRLHKLRIKLEFYRLRTGNEAYSDLITALNDVLNAFEKMK